MERGCKDTSNPLGLHMYYKHRKHRKIDDRYIDTYIDYYDEDIDR